MKLIDESWLPRYTTKSDKMSILSSLVNSKTKDDFLSSLNTIKNFNYREYKNILELIKKDGIEGFNDSLPDAETELILRTGRVLESLYMQKEEFVKERKHEVVKGEEEPDNISKRIARRIDRIRI